MVFCCQAYSQLQSSNVLARRIFLLVEFYTQEMLTQGWKSYVTAVLAVICRLFNFAKLDKTVVAWGSAAKCRNAKSLRWLMLAICCSNKSCLSDNAAGGDPYDVLTFVCVIICLFLMKDCSLVKRVDNKLARTTVVSPWPRHLRTNLKPCMWFVDRD